MLDCCRQMLGRANSPMLREERGAASGEQAVRGEEAVCGEVHEVCGEVCEVCGVGGVWRGLA